MEGILKLTIINDESYEECYITEDNQTNKDYMLVCNLDKNTPINIINNENKILKKTIIEEYIYLSKTKEYYKKLLDIMKKYINDKLDLLNNCTTILITGEEEDIISYLNNNNLLYSKKIIINKKYTTKDYEYIKEKFKTIPNLYLYIEGNEEPISLKEYKKTVNIINEIVNKIKKYNLSPLEQAMYAYDLIRNRVYKEETDNEPLNTSRDLTSVLLGDKIVCVGYAKIFEQVLKELNITSTQYHLENKIETRPGHVSNAVYLKDDKYMIEGIYFFDLTWDSKTNNNDNSYLYSYKYFAKTKQEIDYYYNERYKIKNLNETITETIKNILLTKNFELLTPKIIMYINQMSKFIDSKELLDYKLNIPLITTRQKAIENLDIEKTINKLDTYIKLFNNKIDINTLLKILYNVRRIEYYENPYKYPFDIENFSLIAYNSQWKFDENSKEYFPNVTFSKVPATAIEFKQNMNEYIDKTNLDKKITQLKLVKVLKNIHK